VTEKATFTSYSALPRTPEHTFWCGRALTDSRAMARTRLPPRWLRFVAKKFIGSRCRNRYGQASEAVLELKFRRIRVLPPIGKQSRYPQLELTVLHATERGTAHNRDPIEWKLITDLPITSRAAAIEKLHWYAMRWKIETFHKILKSGCRAEDSKLRTAERLVNLLAMFCILGWRIFWLTMLNRCTRHAPPTLALTALEVDLLSRLTPIQVPQRLVRLRHCKPH